MNRPVFSIMLFFRLLEHDYFCLDFISRFKNSIYGFMNTEIDTNCDSDNLPTMP